MARIDATIPLLARGIQLRDPLIAEERKQDIQMNGLKQQAMQTQMDERNKLRALMEGGGDFKSPDFLRKVYAISPELGMQMESQRSDLDYKNNSLALQRQAMAIKQQELVNAGASNQGQGLLNQQRALDLESSYIKNARNMLPAVNDQASYDKWRAMTIARLPNAAGIIPEEFTPENKLNLMKQADDIIAENKVSNKEEKSLTEGQANNTAYGLRAILAQSQIDAINEKGVEQPGMFRRAVSSIPGIGPYLNTLANPTQSALQQQLTQANASFQDAVLRSDSGATLTKDDIELKQKELFPQPGERASVLAQKKLARDMAIEGLIAKAGPGAKKIRELQEQLKAGKGPTSDSDPLGLR